MAAGSVPNLNLVLLLMVQKQELQKPSNTADVPAAMEPPSRDVVLEEQLLMQKAVPEAAVKTAESNLISMLKKMFKPR